MPAPRRMFGFLKKGSKHRRSSRGSSIGGESEDDIVNIKNEKQSSTVSYQEEESHEDIISSFEPALANADDEESSQMGSYLAPEQDDEEPTQFSSHSINHKPTTATLAETFSSGGVQEMLDHVETRDESIDVQDSEYFYSEHPHAEYEEDGEHIQHDNGYTEFIQGTQEDEDADTLDYTATIHPHDLPYDHCDSMAARHERGEEFNVHMEEGIEAQWEETSLGYETCERTLNTNLEGMNYIPDSSVVHQQRINSFGANGAALAPTGLSHHSEYSNNGDEEPQFYYEQDEYDQYQESYGAEGYYYDDEGQLVGQSYQEGQPAVDGGEYFDPHDDINTLANSTIATEGFDPLMMDQAIISTSFLAPHTEDDESAPIESYESEDTGSSWGDEETRDMSLLDEEGDTVVDDGDDGDEEDGSGSDSDNDSDSDDDESGTERHPPRRRPRAKKSMMDLLTEMKELALNGGSDSSEEDGDEEEDDDDVPGMAQISMGATGTNSYDSEDSGDHQKKQKKVRKKKNRNLDNLFNKVSALGHELLGDEPVSKGKRRKSLRRREQDPATRIVDGLRDIFNCGHPKHY